MVEECPRPRPEAGSVCSLDAVLYYTWEREAIRLARENGFPREQWTTDPIFRKYKFTNIRRRDDRVSRWITEQLIVPHQRAHDLWFMLLIARLINWPPTLGRLLSAGVLPCGVNPLHDLPVWRAEEFVRALEAAQAGGKKTYGSAYMIYPTKSGHPTKARSLAYETLASADWQAENIYAALWDTPVPRVEPVVEALARVRGLNTFMAGQVAADLTYTEHQLGTAVDLYSYAPMGPGSTAGLNYMLGRGKTATWAQDDFNAELLRVREEIICDLGITDLTLHDVQNIMCEYSKYCRVVLGHPAPKNTYKPETEF